MPHVTRRVGPIDVTAITDCDFAESPIVEAFPDVPSGPLLAAKTTYPNVYTEDERWRLRVRAWLVRHPDGLLLLDTGIGGVTAPAHAWAPVVGNCAAELAALGVAPHHVDTVAISHVHDDHIGGVLRDDGEPAFPNAHHLLQRPDLDHLRDVAREDEEAAAILAHLEPLIV